MHKTVTTAAVLASTLVLHAGAAHAGDPGLNVRVTPLMLRGDPVVEDEREVWNFDSVRINNSGSWQGVARQNTAAAAPRPLINWIFRDGVPIWRNAEVLMSPLGEDVALSNFSSSNPTPNYNNLGRSIFDFSTSPVASSAAQSGLVYDTNREFFAYRDMIAYGSVETFDFATWSSFSYLFFNDLNQIFLQATVNDFQLPGNFNRVFLRLTLNDDGEVVQTERLHRDGDILPGVSRVMSGAIVTQTTGAFNNRGEYAFYPIFAADPENPDASDRALIFMSQDGPVVLAEPGQPSPFDGGRAWASNFTNLNVAVDLNNTGGYIFRAPMAAVEGGPAAQAVLVVNGQIVAREGEEAPGNPGYTIESLNAGASPVFLDDEGNYFWWAGLRRTADNVYLTTWLRNDQVLIQRTVTPVEYDDGTGTQYVLNSVGTGPVSFHVSDNGRHAILNGNMAPAGTTTSTFGFFRIEILDDVVPCPGDFNRDGVVNTADITDFLSAWFDARATGATGDADFNDDGVVNTADITAFLSAWFDARAGGC